jgi:tetratricopeptide (TPR) repeat protein
MTPRQTRLTWAVLAAALVVGCTAKRPADIPAPAVPRFPSYPAPEIPASVRVTADLRAQHDVAWRRLQSGDLRGAERDYVAILRRVRDFYPSQAGLGFVALAGRQPREALAAFTAVVARNDRYLPGWLGMADAQLALGREADAIASLQKALAIDPAREGVRERMDLLEFRAVQELIDTGRKAREAGNLDEAQAALDRALALSPSSGAILHELAAVAIARGRLDVAETHLRRAIQIDDNDASAHGTLAAVLERQDRPRDAEAEYAIAYRLDPRSAWKDRLEALREPPASDKRPPELRAITGAATVTRAQLAGLVGTRLGALLEKAPRRVMTIATDVRGNWAESSIMAVTQAGVMDVTPNHLFQPNGSLRRIDLARVVAQLLALANTQRPMADMARWRAARPRFVDLPASNVYYPAAALAVSAGAMTAQEGDRFATTRPATGADVLAAVARIEQIAGR